MVLNMRGLGLHQDRLTPLCMALASLEMLSCLSAMWVRYSVCPCRPFCHPPCPSTETRLLAYMEYRQITVLSWSPEWKAFSLLYSSESQTQTTIQSFVSVLELNFIRKWRSRPVYSPKSLSLTQSGCHLQGTANSLPSGWSVSLGQPHRPIHVGPSKAHTINWASELFCIKPHNSAAF